MNWQPILQNAYYVGTAVGFLVKDILKLRLILILAGLCNIAQAMIKQDNVVIFWVAVFTVINIAQVIRILLEKRDIKLSPEIVDIYKTTFSNMTRKEFQRFWRQGQIRLKASGENLCNDGKEMQQVILIIEGQAEVRKNNKVAARLARCNFIGEMGYLTGKPPSADVVAVENVIYISWSFAGLNRMKEINQNLFNKFHFILSNDLTLKLQRYL